MFGNYEPGTAGYILNVLNEYVPSVVSCGATINPAEQTIMYNGDILAGYQLNELGWPTFCFKQDVYNKQQAALRFQAWAMYGKPEHKGRQTVTKNLRTYILDINDWYSYNELVKHLQETEMLGTKAIKELELSLAFGKVHGLHDPKCILMTVPDLELAKIITREDAMAITFCSLDEEVNRQDLEELIQHVHYEEQNGLVVCEVTVKTGSNDLTLSGSTFSTDVEQGKGIAYAKCLTRLKAHVQLDKALRTRQLQT